eukprot:GILK01007620.1.p1 GENE.GILK01007620.1~~GILK01007620.1.p1  ORF type:complete len:690 (+),score=97.47 GILK01007620.1:295-2070(+)
MATEKDKSLYNLAICDALYYYDTSIIVRVGAQFGLWFGTLLFLGTERHTKYYARVASMELPGCFALTELGHGSNARAIETTATYNPASQTFVIHTPTESAQKYLIGNGLTAEMSTVFAQLFVNGVLYGVHAFIVPLRNPDRTLYKGVKIASCGHKMGLNGVDNGRFWFDNVEIPRENLLNKYGDVTAEGVYESPIPDNDMRFAATLSALVVGRVMMVQGANNMAKIGVATAVKYAEQRRQFGVLNEPERKLMEYTSHQRKLLPIVAQCYVFIPAIHHLTGLMLDRTDDVAEQFKRIKEIHFLASGLKSLSGWHMASSLQSCREACGGQGFKSNNRIGILKADGDAWLTFEGDNSVLMQQVGKPLMKDYEKVFTDSKISKKLLFAPRHLKCNPLQFPFPVVWDDGSNQWVKDTSFLKPEGGHEYMTDLQWLETVMEARELFIFDLLLKRYAAAKADAKSDFGAWNVCTDLAADGSKAHIERHILKRFRADLELPSAVAIRPMLVQLGALWALWTLTHDSRFLALQLLPVGVMSALDEQINVLLTQLRPHAETLVDGFGIPDHLLGVCAKDYVHANSYRQALGSSSFHGKAAL